MLTPAYKITIGDKVIDTTDEPQTSTVVDLKVTLDMNSPADSFTLMLGQVGGLNPVRDDEVTIELGYADDGSLTQVMGGTVITVKPNLTTTRVIGYSAAQSLLRTFVDQTYESKTAGQIVRDLAGQAGADVSAAEDGISFPAYVIDGRRNIHQHMHDLADLCGFDLYINADSELIFEGFTNGNTVHVFEYVQHILELEVLQTPPRADVVQAWGESAGGAGGGEAWAWLTKDFSDSMGSAGSGDPTLLLERPALRTAAAAQTAATAAQTAIQHRAFSGRLLILGRPQVKLGDSIRLREVPEAALNATFQVRSVTHRLSKRNGFTTAVEFRSIS
jgi:phage protein D